MSEPKPIPARRRREDRALPEPPAEPPDRREAEKPARWPALLTVEEAAEELRVSRQYVMALVFRRELEAVRLPGRGGKRERARWRIKRESLVLFHERNTYQVRPLPYFSVVGRRKHGAAN